VPSPVAHVGLAIALRWGLSRPGQPWADRVALACAVASIVPDLDMLLVIALPGGILWHHGPTHSLLGAAAGGLLVAWLARLPCREAWLPVVAGLMHVPLDYLTGEPGGPSHFGVPVFWPLLTERMVSPWPWFIPFGIDREGFLAHMFTPGAARAYGREVVTVLVGFALARYGRGSSTNS